MESSVVSECARAPHKYTDVTLYDRTELNDEKKNNKLK